jgi:class I fructose-bisphosphate aldolase
MLFACDQKVEHLNDDFYGDGIAPEDAEPEHLFRIGDQGICGVLAGQRGLIAQYAADYPDINYLVKMNSKTHLVKTSAKDPAKHQDDPYSPQLYDIQTVLDLRENGVNAVGVGYTIYLGSEYEANMMQEAGQLIADAHSVGLLVVLWIYPRGKAVVDEKDAHLIAGAAGVAVSLGADFVKVNPPKGDDEKSSAETLKEAAAVMPRDATSTSARSTRPSGSPRPSAPSRSATGRWTTHSRCSTARRSSPSSAKVPVIQSAASPRWRCRVIITTCTLPRVVERYADQRLVQTARRAPVHGLDR